MTTTSEPAGISTDGLTQRARNAMPAGVYGHMSTRLLAPQYPQFIADGTGCRMHSIDGREYIDFLCGYGPIVLGRQHPSVERAVAKQLGNGECLTGIPPVMVELCELLVETVAHADWAMLARNGTDATTMCVTIARAATGRRRILLARGSYHGAAPWCTPIPSGVLPEDRAHLGYFDYNDVASLRAAVEEAGDDLAGVILTPHHHDNKAPQASVDPAFAHAARDVCTRAGAVLILDDVRAGFRFDVAGTWEPLGVQPDLSAFSKAIANGHPLAAVTGTDALRDAAAGIYVTGSFWYSGAAMAAAVATINELRSTTALAQLKEAGELLRDGLLTQAAHYGFAVSHTGPVQMPLLIFTEDPSFATAERFAGLAVERGVYLHPHHNWFLSAAHTPDDIADALDRTDDAFAALANAR